MPAGKRTSLTWREHFDAYHRAPFVEEVEDGWVKCACGNTLTRDEFTYYGGTCEKCERRFTEAMQNDGVKLHDKIAVFNGGSDYTPEQLLLELFKYADEIEGLAFAFQWKPEDGEERGAFQAGWSRMPWSDVYLAYGVGMDKIMSELRGERRVEQEL